MKLIFKFVLVFIIITTSVSAYLLLNNEKPKATESKPVYEPFCGTQSDRQNNGDTQKGKQIFNVNCAACHKLDAVATGPALRDVARKYHEHNMQLYNYLKGKRDGLLLRKPNKSSMGLCPLFPDLTKQDVASLEAYTH